MTFTESYAGEKITCQKRQQILPTFDHIQCIDKWSRNSMTNRAPCSHHWVPQGYHWTNCCVWLDLFCSRMMSIGIVLQGKTVFLCLVTIMFSLGYCLPARQSSCDVFWSRDWAFASSSIAHKTPCNRKSYWQRVRHQLKLQTQPFATEEEGLKTQSLSFNTEAKV